MKTIFSRCPQQYAIYKLCFGRQGFYTPGATITIDLSPYGSFDVIVGADGTVDLAALAVALNASAAFNKSWIAYYFDGMPCITIQATKSGRWKTMDPDISGDVILPTMFQVEVKHYTARSNC